MFKAPRPSPSTTRVEETGSSPCAASSPGNTDPATKGEAPEGTYTDPFAPSFLDRSSSVGLAIVFGAVCVGTVVVITGFTAALVVIGVKKVSEL